jgi:ProP effector
MTQPQIEMTNTKDRAMTAVEQVNRLPIKQRPVLRLKLGPAPKPAATASVKVAEAAPEPPRAVPYKISAERAAAIAVERAAEASRLALREAIQQRAIKTMETLMDRFPLCFNKPVPLKVGIRKDVYAAAPDLDRHDVVNALNGYCNSEAYKAVLVEGATRIDLNGDTAGVVTRSHVTLAAKHLRNEPQH